MSRIKLPNRIISHGEPCYIIAEAGVNHNGDMSMARELIDIAADCGADAVKFQTFKAEEIILRNAPKARYHIETTGSDSEQSWFDLLKNQELDRAMHEELIDYCADRGIDFLSTPYDWSSVDLLAELGVPMFKVASTDANNLPFLRYIASKKLPIILSTAMCNLAEVKNSVEAIRAMGVGDVVVMQCTGSYPAPIEQANLRAMNEIARQCDVAVGYSDHVPGFNSAIGAIALGACTYEKHFTLDRNLPGPDHRVSLEPSELKNLIICLKEVESALGDGKKDVMDCEVDNRSKLRKYIVSSRDIKKGQLLAEEMLTTKRTGGLGIDPTRWDEIIGKNLLLDVVSNTPIMEDMFE